MSGWRTNRETGEHYPVDSSAGSGIDVAIENVLNQPEPKAVNPNRCNCTHEGHGHDTRECGSGFGKMLEVSPTEYLCESCTYRILAAEGLTDGLETPVEPTQAVQPTAVQSSSPDVCSKCGMQYGNYRGSHGDHWKQFHAEEYQT